MNAHIYEEDIILQYVHMDILIQCKRILNILYIFKLAIEGS
jgi:hypothetical protein